MYMTSLYFHLIASPDKENILKMFFEDWVDTICNNKLRYSTVSDTCIGLNVWNEIIKVEFENPEDAVALKLKGVPKEFQNYLQIIELKH